MARLNTRPQTPVSLSKVRGRRTRTTFNGATCPLITIDLLFWLSLAGAVVTSVMVFWQNRRSKLKEADELR